VRDDIKAEKLPALEWLPDEAIPDQILRLLKENGPMTQRMLCEAVIGGNTTVYRAIDALIEAKRVEQGRAKDPVSGRVVKAFRLKA